MRGFLAGLLLLPATLAPSLALAAPPMGPASAPAAAPESAPEKSPQLLHFKLNGFSIAPLETRAIANDYMALQMFMGPTGGFTPDINVQVAQVSESMDQYMDATKRQLARAHFELLNATEPKEDSASLEYTGSVRAQRMHWYARATLWKGRVYLAVAACTETQWPTLSLQLRACADSLAAEKGQEAPDDGRLHFKAAGFSIEPMEAKAIPPQSTILVMNLAGGAGLKPQVNVLIQPYLGTMDDYIAHTQKEMDIMKYGVLEKNRPSLDSVTYEFSGDLGGRHMHWYTRTVLRNHQLYVAAAAGGEEQWPGIWKQMKACADSLEVDKPAPAATP